MDRFQQAIGKRIRGARIRIGLKQQEAADAINMSRSNYQKIESGHIGVSAIVLMKLARLFKTPFEEFTAPDNYEPADKHGQASEKNDNQYGSNSATNVSDQNLHDKIALLEKLLADKDEIIALLKDRLKKVELS